MPQAMRYLLPPVRAMTTCPPKFLASQPMEPKRYFGSSYKGRRCTKHKVKLVLEDEGRSCECCGDFEPKYCCPKCEKIYNAAFRRWFRKWGHIVAVADHLDVVKGRIRSMTPDIRYYQFLHGGKPLKKGQWCKRGDDGFIKLSRKPWTPNMLVVD